MSTNILRQGYIFYSGFTNLTSKRGIPQKSKSSAYDAVFNCTDTGNPNNSTEGVGSFRYYCGRDNIEREEGNYQVEAKVVGFVPGRNPQSELFNDKEVNLLGQIDSMQPLSNDEDDEGNYDTNIYISGSGTVSSTETDSISFVIHATQYVSGGDRSDEIAVRGRMNRTAKWSKPLDLLPKPLTIVSFRGILEDIGSYTAPNSKKPTTCLNIAMDDITFLYNAPSTTTKQNKGNIRQKIDARIKKRKMSPSSSQSMGPSEASTSQKKLEERKPESDEEVENSMQTM